MFKVLFITDTPEYYKNYKHEFYKNNLQLELIELTKYDSENIPIDKYDLILLDIEQEQQLLNSHPIWEMTNEIKPNRSIPIIAVLPISFADQITLKPEISDFIIKPLNITELLIRIKRSLKLKELSSHEIIKCGDLIIDDDRCEVYLAGKNIELTYTEYQLLKLLAKNKNRVFSRETLLDRIWGQDYYGGDRTVDVHIRRLRSKIEDAEHSFIETVRNIGYKFKNQT